MSAGAGRGPDSPENPYAGQGSVLLDIGEDVGALVVTMPGELTGAEVEVLGEALGEVLGEDERPRGPVHHHDHDHGAGPGRVAARHVAVVRRPLPGGGEVPTLVYPELQEGRYRLVPVGGATAVLEVVVRGGEVTLADWPDPDRRDPDRRDPDRRDPDRPDPDRPDPDRPGLG